MFEEKLKYHFVSVCPNPPPAPADAASSPMFVPEDVFFENNAIDYSCVNSLFTIPNDNVAVCQATGLWMPSAIPNCVQQCKMS